MKPEFQLHILRGLLHYHLRMTLAAEKCPAEDCQNAAHTGGKCPNTSMLDGYAETLREAIRCIEIVHKDELNAREK